MRQGVPKPKRLFLHSFAWQAFISDPIQSHIYQAYCPTFGMWYSHQCSLMSCFWLDFQKLQRAFHPRSALLEALTMHGDGIAACSFWFYHCLLTTFGVMASTVAQFIPASNNHISSNNAFPAFMAKYVMCGYEKLWGIWSKHFPNFALIKGI